MKGSSLAGTSLTRKRVENDFYATPAKSVEAILKKEFLYFSILEPACGEGHISTILHNHYPTAEIVSTDLIEREDKFNCGIKSGIDFLTYDYGRKFDTVITNPPFSLAQEFIERALEIANKKVIMFCKIQLLEGQKRKEWFEKTPLKRVYVFSDRQNPLRNGNPLNEQGKKWSSTFCFAWFVWEKGYTGEPVIRWL